VVGLLSPSSGWVVQLEGPQEVGGVLEVGSNSEDLVDQVLNTDDAHLAQLALDDLVGGDGSAVAIDLDKPTLVDQITDSFQVGAAVGDVRLSQSSDVQDPVAGEACGRNGRDRQRLSGHRIKPSGRF